MNKNNNSICAIALAIAIILFACVSFMSKQQKFALADDNFQKKCVYLTFDDGPSDRVTPKILDILQKENVKATFFIIGVNALTRQNIVKREFDEGHTVGVHSYTHEYKKIYSSPQKLVEDITLCNNLIKSITGEYSAVYRFPGGSYNLSQKLISAVTSIGLRYVDWNSSTRDAELFNQSADKLLNNVISTAANSENVVLLCHDSTSKTSTVQALPSIIKYFRENDYIFKTF